MTARPHLSTACALRAGTLNPSEPCLGPRTTRAAWKTTGFCRTSWQLLVDLMRVFLLNDTPAEVTSDDTEISNASNAELVCRDCGTCYPFHLGEDAEYREMGHSDHRWIRITEEWEAEALPILFPN